MIILQLIVTLLIVSKISFGWAGDNQTAKIIAMIVVGILVLAFSWYIVVILAIYFVICLLK